MPPWPATVADWVVLGAAALAGSGMALWAAFYARGGFFWALACGIAVGALLCGCVGGVVLGSLLPNGQYYGYLVTVTYGTYGGFYGSLVGATVGWIWAPRGRKG